MSYYGSFERCETGLTVMLRGSLLLVQSHYSRSAQIRSTRDMHTYHCVSSKRERVLAYQSYWNMDHKPLLGTGLSSVVNR